MNAAAPLRRARHLIAGMAKRAAADDRPAVVFYFSDFDPSGHQMSVSVSRKLQALCDLRPGLQISLRPVALTLEQVRDLGLPSSPLKARRSEPASGNRRMVVSSKPKSTR